MGLVPQETPALIHLSTRNFNATGFQVFQKSACAVDVGPDDNKNCIPFAGTEYLNLADNSGIFVGKPAGQTPSTE